MTKSVFMCLEVCFSEEPDPRVQARCDHQPIDNIIIAVCAVISCQSSRPIEGQLSTVYWLNNT